MTRRRLYGPKLEDESICHPPTYTRKKRGGRWVEQVTVMWQGMNWRGCFSSWHWKKDKV